MFETYQVARKSCRRFMLVVGIILAGVFGVRSASASDAAYECVPSGFTLGLPPFKGAVNFEADFERQWDLTPSISYKKIQAQLAEALAKSSLFSDVLVYKDDMHPDSTDLTLLVTIPVFRRISSGIYLTFEMVADVILVENLGGRTLFQKSYRNRYESTYVQGLSTDKLTEHRMLVDVQIGFATIIAHIIADLDETLNSYPDPALTELATSRVVRHSHLEPLFVAPTQVWGRASGLANYARFVEDQLRERLAGKNCFDFPPLKPELKDCLKASLAEHLDDPIAALKVCADILPAEGMLTVSYLSSNLSSTGDNIHIRSVLVLMPGLQVLYDRTIVTASGWRFGNALEKLAAGIAQASHTVPH